MLTKVLVEGPYLTQSGYGEHARFVIRSLMSRPEVDLYAVPTGWGQTSWLWQDNEERQLFDDLTLKTIKYTTDNPNVAFDIHVPVGIPGEHTRKAPYMTLVTAGIETTKVSPNWVAKTREVDSIIVPSTHSKRSFDTTVYNVPRETSHVGIDSNVSEEIVEVKCDTETRVVSYPVRTFAVDKAFQKSLKFETKFNFLSIAQWSPRKNIFATAKWFLDEFKDEEVGLILKTNQARNCHLDFVKTRDMISKFIKSNSPEDRKCKVYFLHGDLTEQQMAALYTHNTVKALVTTTHGEGFGLPLFEACNYGLPVVSPGWGGQLDFLTATVRQSSGKKKKKALYGRVEYSLSPVQREAVWPGVIEQDSMWCFAKEDSFKNRLRDVYKNHGMYKSWAKKLQKHLASRCSEEKMYKEMSEVILQPVTQALNNMNIRKLS